MKDPDAALVPSPATVFVSTRDEIVATVVAVGIEKHQELSGLRGAVRREVEGIALAWRFAWALTRSAGFCDEGGAAVSAVGQSLLDASFKAAGARQPTAKPY